ncbi:MAG: HlyD family efflux transporter periplasmic adaptor subunit [Terracidiphilus sp.]|jgi:multidrug efflux pump subunit AcrA (membrane-fusion protein)
MKRHRVLTSFIVLLLFAAGIGAVVASNRVHLAASKDEIPLAEVKRGALDLDVHAIGELRASHEIMISAPAIGGDSLQITELARTGEMVKKGDIVLAFDPSEQHYKLEQNHSEFLQAEQEITKAKADAAVLAAEDKVAVLKARYNVRRAELDVQKDELESKIDADKNHLALQQAQRVLTELEKDAESHKATGQAAIYLAQEKSNKASIAMTQAQQNLEKMKVVAPMDGLISIKKNQQASGGMYFTGMTLPDYRPGDQVYSGSAIADVIDPVSLELSSKVSEQDHGNIRPGEAVEVAFDALPGRVFHGTVKSVGGMSTHQMFEASSSGGFEVLIQLTESDARLRSGFTAQILFKGGSQSNMLTIPRQALFLKDGKRVVFVKDGNGFDQREVKIQSQSESRAAVSGVEAGNMVAMIDPTAPRKTSAGSNTTGGSEGTP